MTTSRPTRRGAQIIALFAKAARETGPFDDLVESYSEVILGVAVEARAQGATEDELRDGVDRGLAILDDQLSKFISDTRAAVMAALLPNAI